MRRLLMLPKYGLLAASPRQRFYAYAPHLEQAGVEVTVSELFSNRYLERYFAQGKRPLKEVVKGYRRRLKVLSKAAQFDAVMVHFECLPYLSAFSEERLFRRGIPYVLDFDDAIHHQYDRHRNPLVRGLLGNKIEKIVRQASAVLAGNEYLAGYAEAAGCRRVEILPTVIDHERYVAVPPRKPYAKGTPITIGWMGSRSTVGYLKPIIPLIERIAQNHPLRLLIIDAGEQNFTAPSIEHRPWREDREIADLSEMDIGIMPLPDTPWERGKCGYKLIQYMGVGKPVVASPVGVNRHIVEHGVNGFLATSLEEWVRYLRTLIEDPDLRTQMGQAGRANVERQYCLDVTAPILVDLLKSLVSGQ